MKVSLSSLAQSIEGKVLLDIGWVNWDSTDEQDWPFSIDDVPINPSYNDPRNRVITRVGLCTDADRDPCLYFTVEGIDETFRVLDNQQISIGE